MVASKSKASYMISVIIPTYKRDWALPYSLGSLKEQSHVPDEVVVVLQPSNNESEKIIEKFSSSLNINLVIKRKTNVTDAVSVGIKASQGDILLFLDDDAIAEKNWVEKYLRIFKMLPDAGGVTGIVYTALRTKNHIIKTEELFYEEKTTRMGPHRRPLAIFKNYAEYLSDSGISGRRPFSASIIRSSWLCEGNMGWRREALIGSDFAEAFRESRVGAAYGHYLACYARLKGYHTYRVVNPKLSPIIWHMRHPFSLHGRPMWSEFWRSFDEACNYWRLRRLNLQTSFLRYVVGLMILSRCKTHLRIPAYVYGFIKGVSLICDK